MATLSSTGIGSGLDVNSIITQMMALERRPLNLLQQAKSGLDTKLSAIGTLQSRMSGLLDAANALTADALWTQKVATSSNTAAVTASGNAQAVDGSFAVQVNTLSSRQTVVSASFPATAERVAGGTLTIELGTWTGAAAPDDLTPKSGATPVVVNIPATGASFAELRDLINAADAGVTATLITDASGTRLALRSNETGAQNGFRISAVTADAADAQSVSLDGLAYSPTQPSGMTRTQVALNARATVNGIPIESATNTLSSDMLAGVADGLTLNLSRVTTEELEVKVGNDRANLRKAIEGFVNAYNEVDRVIRDQTAYNPDSKVGGTLQGDPMVNALRTQMRAIIGGAYGSSTGEPGTTTLNGMGIAFTSTGALSLDGAKLTRALDSDAQAVRTLMSRTGEDRQHNGIAQKFAEFADMALGSNGMFATRTTSLKGQITQNERRQEGLDRRLSQTEERMRRQYQALDATMSNLGGTSNYLTQQLELLSGNSRNR